MKSYSAAPDVQPHIERMREAHHEDLKQAIINGMFVFDTESSLPMLTHQGYPALATVKITPLKERAIGVADAIILVDRARWLTLSARQRDAIIDHELTHLARKVDKETGDLVVDALDRPKLTLRRHDHHFGWFDHIAQRHGDASVEVAQARRLIESSGQFYFDFASAPAPLPRERKILERADLNS